FTNQLSTLQDAGLPIVRSLKILQGQMKAGNLKNALTEVADDVESGFTFSDSLAKHPKIFDKLYVNMVKAGEMGGVLDTILRRLSEFMDKSEKLKRRIKGAATYPVAVLVISLGIVIGILILVVPNFEKIFNDLKVTLPAPTQLLIAMSRQIYNMWWVALVGILGFIFVYRLISSNKDGKALLDRFYISLPIMGDLIRKSSISRFTRTLGTLISSGVPILEALSIVKNAISNSVIANAIGSVYESIREGESIAEPLAKSGEFDDIVINMIDVGEETGELDKMMIKIADNYDEEVDILVGAMVSMLEPMLIIFLGGTVGFIVIALFMPMIQLVNTL
ncbi:MAG TPA: type II secretion system F family protein, partial [Planctomycetota bacterium]|nr:type II secretion system F family protein [Planctomycetota bacterium]